MVNENGNATQRDIVTAGGKNSGTMKLVDWMLIYLHLYGCVSKKKACIAAEVDVHEHVRLPCKIVAAWQLSSPRAVQCSAALVLPHLL